MTASRQKSEGAVQGIGQLVEVGSAVAHRVWTDDSRPLRPLLGQAVVGDLVAGQNVELVLAVRSPQADAGVTTKAFFTIGDRDGVLKADGCTLAWEHAEAAAVDAWRRSA